MEHCLSFLIIIFQVLLFFLCRDPGRQEIVTYLLPKHWILTNGSRSRRVSGPLQCVAFTFKIVLKIVSVATDI